MPFLRHVFFPLWDAAVDAGNAFEWVCRWGSRADSLGGWFRPGIAATEVRAVGRDETGAAVLRNGCPKRYRSSPDWLWSVGFGGCWIKPWGVTLNVVVALTLMGSPTGVLLRLRRISQGMQRRTAKRVRGSSS